MHCRAYEMYEHLKRADAVERAPGRTGRDRLFGHLCRRDCVFMHRVRRSVIPLLLSALRITGPSVEVGVWLGDYSSVLLNKWYQSATHTLVDPYAHFPCPANGLEDKQCQLDQRTFDAVFHNVSRRMRNRYGERVELVRDFSVPASRRFQNSSLGFAYIDARHDFDAVTEDMDAWWPKVRLGGVVAGHDFTHMPLARAVLQFVRKHGNDASVFVTADHPASWIIAKC